MHNQCEIVIDTNGPGLTEFSEQAHQFVADCSVDCGLLTVFVRHTSASLLIQENADRDVCRDLSEFFSRLVPEGMDWLRHTLEGLDDMPAHIKAALTATSLTVPISDGRLALGTWQGLYLFEHRRQPHHRRVVLHVSGQTAEKSDQ